MVKLSKSSDGQSGPEKSVTLNATISRSKRQGQIERAVVVLSSGRGRLGAIGVIVKKHCSHGDKWRRRPDGQGVATTSG